VNHNLFMAAVWFTVGIGILFFLPNTGENALITVDPGRRIIYAGAMMLFVGYNLVRWRLARLRRQSDQDYRAMQPPVRARHRDEPPNPDFDFSDPKPGDSPRDPSSPRPPGSR
jgi:hypothetical protein